MNKYQYACDVCRRAMEIIKKGLEENRLLKFGAVFEEIIHQDQKNDLRAS